MSRTIFEGRKTTTRTAAMIQEARRLWHASPKSNGKHHPALAQGGYNGGGVAASGGTHDKDAIDFDTSYLTNMENRHWERICRTVGFKAWWRPKIPGLWNEHCHAVPENGDLSPAAQVQVKAAHAERNGLRSNLYDPTWDGLQRQTWEKYLASRPKPAPRPARVKISGDYYADVDYVSLDRLRKAWVSGKRSVDVWWLQKWLTRLGYYKAPRDGLRGPITHKAWVAFITHEHLKDPGLPNLTALKRLAQRAKTVKSVRR